jgi:hypothetical protein
MPLRIMVSTRKTKQEDDNSAGQGKHNVTMMYSFHLYVIYACGSIQTAHAFYS